MKKALLILCSLLLINVAPLAAAAEDDSVFFQAEICEKISASETVKQAMVRASDKAIIKAISTMSVLSLPKEKFSNYDFNILVYDLADNYANNVEITTTKQNYDSICISAAGNIDSDDLIASIIKVKKIADEKNAARKDSDFDYDEFDRQHQEIGQAIIEEAQISPIEISGDAYLSEEDYPITNTKVIIKDSSTIVVVEDDELESDEIIDPNIRKASVYISDTKLFNNTTSKAYHSFLSDLFTESDFITTTSSKELADYIISPHILRIKLDSVNDTTSRMQIVTLLEAEDLENNNIIKEHQNRFILISSEIDEQQAAQELTEKLFEKASKQIVNKIELSERKKNNITGLPKMITPSSLTP